MRGGLRVFLAACALVAVAQFAAPVALAEDKPDDAARRFVEQVNDASMSFFSSGSDQDAREKCRQLLSWAFDVPAMGEYVLGKAWASASEEDRKEFLAAFEDEIVGEYLHRMKGGTTMTFVGTRTPVGGDLLAASRVAVTGKNDQDMDLADAAARTDMADRRCFGRRTQRDFVRAQNLRAGS